jgi:hypothetical protein
LAELKNDEKELKADIGKLKNDLRDVVKAKAELYEATAQERKR